MVSSFGPPPPRFAQAQPAPVIKPADPFDEIVIMTPKEMKKAAEAALPKYKSIRGD